MLLLPPALNVVRLGPVPSPKPVLERSTLPLAVAQVMRVEEGVVCLRRHQKTLQARPLHAEWAVLGRVGYRNHNPHRGAVHHQKYQGCRRLARRWTTLDPGALVHELLQLLHPSSTKRKQGPWECLPAPGYLAHCLARLVGAFALLQQV
jgi:hypothetical protein